MKNAITVIAIVCCFPYSINAQKIATWKGGAPGRSTDWACAANWKEGRIPDAFSDVLIPDVSTNGNFQPSILREAAPIHSLRILSGATLRIETSGILEVEAPIQLIGNGNIRNRGQLNALILPELHDLQTGEMTLWR